ncbi:MAG TPA: Ger(x)C family spore germination protein, partial [Candidatus Bathyarchaeia archaeon]|nr:Ger(x)C family spore germination protein [Candidatus Bathyarchaeia archaeon]
MSRYPAFHLFLVLLLFFTTGCWSRKEMNDIAIVMGIGIDKVGDEYLLSTQIVNPSQVAQRGSGGMPMSSVTTYSTKGKSLLEGIRRLTKLTPRKLYFAHIRVLAIDEHLAKDGLQDVLDFFMRQQEIRTDFYVIITKNVNAFNVMSIYDPLE